MTEDRPYATLSRQYGAITGLTWLPGDDRLAVIAETDPAVTFWAPETGRRIAVLPAGPDATGPMAWSRDGSRVATAHGDAAVGVWDTATGALVATLACHSREVTGIAWSDDGDRLVAAGDNGLLIIRSLSDPGFDTRIRLEPVSEVAWTSAGLAAASATGVVVFDVR